LNPLPPLTRSGQAQTQFAQRQIEKMESNTKSLKDIRSRRWEKKWTRVGNMKIIKWVPSEPRTLQHVKIIAEKNNAPAPRYRVNAPITRSVAATLDKEYRKSVKASTPKVTTRSSKKQQQLSPDSGNLSQPGSPATPTALEPDNPTPAVEVTAPNSNLVTLRVPNQPEAPTSNAKKRPLEATEPTDSQPPFKIQKTTDES